MEPDRTHEPQYEVYAVQYARVASLAAERVQIESDPHAAAHDMSYYLWVIRGAGTVVVVDCGFNPQSGAKRGRHLTRPPGDALRDLGIAPEDVPTVILTHLHYDHAGNLGLFPSATFHVQDAEVNFATGRLMRHRYFQAMYELDDVVGFLQAHYGGRVIYHDGPVELLPGIALRRVPGHTPGLQCVRVNTRSGSLVLASDACHFSFLRRQGEAYPVLVDAAALLEGYSYLQTLASEDRMIIPGHDPAVMEQFPAARADLQGLAVRLD